MVGVGRDLWRLSSTTLVLNQGHLEQATQDCVQVGFEYVQGRRCHNSSGQPVPVTLKVKKFFLVFRWNFLCFILCPLPLVLSLGTTNPRKV